MKKAIAFILLSLAVLSLAACSAKEKSGSDLTEERAKKWDMIPMVMVDGVLYLDTGMKSTADGRCGNMDGEITSEVDGSKKPTEDDQSNFGKGFGYQFGSQEGTIEIFINGDWWIYATEEVREQIQFPSN